MPSLTAVQPPIKADRAALNLGAAAMPSKMPSSEELRLRYQVLEQNERIDRLANWAIPNTSQPFDEIKDDQFLQFMENTGESYHNLLQETLQAIKTTREPSKDK